MSTSELARQALSAAARTRLKAGLDAYTAICVFDLAEHLEIDLRFQALPSLEGMYSPGDPPIVIVSALRPSGRQRANCAHEIGHHVFGHGTRIDQLIDDNGRSPQFEPEEFIANCFAEYLLMPKLAVLSTLNARAIDIASIKAIDVYRLSSYFGVGYRTLIHHLHQNVRTISQSQAVGLRKSTPKAIRCELVGNEVVTELVVADQHWRGRPIDLHVGDMLLLPLGSLIEGGLMGPPTPCPSGQLFCAKAPGIARALLSASGWSSYVRVARRVQGGGYAGRSIYRHEPDTGE